MSLRGRIVSLCKREEAEITERKGLIAPVADLLGDPQILPLVCLCHCVVALLQGSYPQIIEDAPLGVAIAHCACERENTLVVVALGSLVALVPCNLAQRVQGSADRALVSDRLGLA